MQLIGNENKNNHLSSSSQRSATTYVSIVVQCVVGELHLVEHNRLGGPVRPEGGAVRMKAEPLRALGFGATRRNPLGPAKLEPTVADGHHLQQHAVIGVRVQSVHGKAHRGEHSPAVGERREKGKERKSTHDVRER